MSPARAGNRPPPPHPGAAGGDGPAAACPGAPGGGSGGRASVQRYRARASLPLAAAAGFVLAAAVADVLGGGPGRAGTDLRVAAAAVAAAGVVYGTLVRPVLVADADGLVIRNPLRTVRVPWSAVAAIDGGLSVVVRTGDRRVTVWAVPVSLRQRAAARRRAACATRAAAGHGLAYPLEPAAAWADDVVRRLRARLAAERADAVSAPACSGGGPEPSAAIRWCCYPAAVAAVSAALLLAGLVW